MQLMAARDVYPDFGVSWVDQTKRFESGQVEYLRSPTTMRLHVISLIKFKLDNLKTKKTKWSLNYYIELIILTI